MALIGYLSFGVSLDSFSGFSLSLGGSSLDGDGTPSWCLSSKVSTLYYTRHSNWARQNHSSSTQGTPTIPSLLHHTGVGARESPGHGPQSELPCPGPLSDSPGAVTSTCDTALYHGVSVSCGLLVEWSNQSEGVVSRVFVVFGVFCHILLGVFELSVWSLVSRST
ncbi:hypothetical protein Bca4012_031829 [Brassica carinata]